MKLCTSPAFKNILATHEVYWKQNYQTPEMGGVCSGDDICSSRSRSSCAAALQISHYCSAQTVEGEAVHPSSSGSRRRKNANLIFENSHFLEEVTAELGVTPPQPPVFQRR